MRRNTTPIYSVEMCIRDSTGTDHTREKVPFLAYSGKHKGSGSLPEEDTFAVIGATIADNFSVDMPDHTIGHSILDQLR